VLLFCGSVALAQVNEQKQDTTKTGYSKENKKSLKVLSAYMTRLPTDIFILIQLMGFPLIINYIDTKQYESLVLKDRLFQEKRPMLSTVKRGRRLLRKICYQILRKFKPFESILAIRLIKPTGSVEMDLGALHKTR
jgi:hypothetical protein